MRVNEETFARMPFASPSSPRYEAHGQAATITWTGFTAPTPSEPEPKKASGRR